MRPAAPPSTRALEEARARLDAELTKNPDDPKLLLLRGRADERLEQFDEAAHFFKRAATILHEQRDMVGEAAAVVEAAAAFGRASRFTEAQALFAKAIARYLELGDGFGTARARLAFAKVRLAAQQFDEARTLLEQCLEPLEAASDWETLGWVNEQLVTVSPEDLALSRARAAVECAAKAKDRGAFGQRLAIVARLHRDSGNWGKAKQYQEKALPYLKASADWVAVLSGYEVLVQAARMEGDLTRAEAVLRQAIEVADEVKKPGFQGRLRATWASVLLEKDDPSGALALLDTAIKQLHAAGDLRSSAPAFLDMGRVLHRLGDMSGALKALDRSKWMFEQLGDTVSAASVAAVRERTEAGELG